MDPKVSVIIPIYGVEKYLVECLDSVVAQTYKNLEIILVDDASPDASGQIADKYAKKDSRIKVIHKAKNQGLNMARATGVEASTGGFVTFVDSDDKILPTFVEILVQAQLKTNADITMTGYIFYDEKLEEPLSPQPTKQHTVQKEPAEYTRDQMIRHYLTQETGWNHNNNTTTTCCKLFRDEVIKSVDWAACDYTIGEDDFETVYTFAHAKKFSAINNQLYLYRANPTSISSSKKLAPRYQGVSISVFDLCSDLEEKALKLFGNDYIEDIYYRVYNIYQYYIGILLKKNSFYLNDIISFDKNFPLKSIQKVHKYKIDSNVLGLINDGGLAHYLTVWLSDQRDKVEDLEFVVSEKDQEINRLRNEIMLNSGIKQSVRQVARGVKRRIRGE